MTTQKNISFEYDINRELSNCSGLGGSELISISGEF